MKVIIDAKNFRLGFFDGDQPIEWKEVDKKNHQRFTELLKGDEDIEHIFVFQQGATFSDARAAVVLANTLMFAGQVPVTALEEEIEDVAVLNELAQKALKGERTYLEVQYSSAPSITKPKKF